jgi:hypothetical protein
MISKQNNKKWQRRRGGGIYIDHFIDRIIDRRIIDHRDMEDMIIVEIWFGLFGVVVCFYNYFFFLRLSLVFWITM